MIKKSKKVSFSSSDPLLTIVIPVLNGEKYISEAISSVINEKKYVSIELIVVDGASTDNTLEILKKFNNNIDVLISEPDSGQSCAYNKAFKIAKGEYLMWLESDDIIIKDSFKYLYPMLVEKQYFWIAFNTIILSEDGKPTKFVSGITPPNFIKRHHHFVDCPSSIFHRNVFKNIGPVDESLHYTMDVEYWYRMIKAGYSFKRCSNYVYGFRMHSKSKTGLKGYKKTHTIVDKTTQDRYLESMYIKEKYQLVDYPLIRFLKHFLKLRPSRVKDWLNLYLDFKVN